MLSKYPYIVKIIIVASLLGLLSSCGFRLRGDVEVPAVLSIVHISGVAEYADLNQELKRVLQRSGSQITKTRETAKSVVNISSEQWRKRVLSVDSQGLAAEYELNYRFLFTVEEASTDEVKDPDKPVSSTVLVPQQKIDLTRDFRFDPNNVLATEAEEKQIRLEMVRFAVRQMMRRIRSHLKYSGEKSPG